MSHKLRILHGLTDVAGQGSYSVLGLQAIGLDAKLVTWRGNPLQYSNDFSLGISRNKWLYPWYAVKMGAFAVFAFFRFNVFHFHAFRSLLPFNLDLFVLKLFRKRIFMEFHGSELRMRNIIDGSPLHNRKKVSRLKRVLGTANAIILHDAELRPYIGTNQVPVLYLPLRLDISRFQPRYPDPANQQPLIVHAPTNPELKGTRHILAAIEKLATKHDFNFQLIRGLSQDEAIRIYQEADIIVDQLLGGTYGVFAVEGMALGKPVICFVTDEMKEVFPEELPVISADRDTIEEAIEKLLLDGTYRNEIGMQGRSYAENYHNHLEIAKLLERIYRGDIEPEDQRTSFDFVKKLAQGKQ